MEVTLNGWRVTLKMDGGHSKWMEITLNGGRITLKLEGHSKWTEGHSKVKLKVTLNKSEGHSK